MLTKEQQRTMFVCLVLVLGTILLYGPAVSFDFIVLDDPMYVVTNPHITNGFNWRDLRWCFQAGYAANWHPLTWMSHMLDCSWFGLKPGGPHAVNLLLHAANSVLLFVVLKRMTGAFWRSAMVAALFAWHPLHVESVAWIAERKDVLSAFCWILTIWAYFNYVKNGGGARYCLALALFILGLMAKPMVVTLPFVLLLLDWWPLGRFQVKPARPWRLLLEKIPFIIFAAASCILTVIAQGRMAAIASLDYIPLKLRVVNSLEGYLRYAGKIFWPTDLSVIYPLPSGWKAGEITASATFIIVISLSAVIVRRTRPYWIMGWLWFLGTLLPVIGLVQAGSQSMADRYAYIPSIGFFIMVCWGAYDLAGHWRFHEALLGLAGGAALAACALITETQLGYWQDSETLFRHALAVDPNNYIIHGDYGTYLYNQNDLAKAREECQKAIQIAPESSLGHVYLARVLLAEGKKPEATSELRTALKYEPNLAAARAVLGDILLSDKSYGEAAVEYGKAVAIAPAQARWHQTLGRALVFQGKFDEACRQFKEALHLNASDVDAHYDLAGTLSMQQKTAEAITEYRMVLKLQPDFADALNNLAWILAANPNPQLRNGREAVQFAERACALTQNKQPFIVGTLAAAYAEAGRFEDAAASAQKARDIALALGQKEVAARNLELLELYKAHKPYHEPAPGQ